MSKRRILLIYKSTTGFTERYAQMIAKETGCKLIKLKDAATEQMSEFDTVIFGGRLHAGSIDGLKKAREIIRKSGIKRVIIFATGAMPAEAEEEIDKMWKNNLSPAEREHMPHFYFPAGLCYERMPFSDRLMMKTVSIMLRQKKNKTAYDLEMEKGIAHSYDISSREYIRPLTELFTSAKAGGETDGR